MWNYLDYEKLRHILEKAEKLETLDNNEKKYLDIIKILKEEKNKKIEIDTKFQDNLKEELLLKYDSLYKKKWLYYKIMSFLEFPIIRFAVSFCFVFSISLWVYNGLNYNYENNTNLWWSKFDSKSINLESLSINENVDKILPEVSSIKESKKRELSSPSSAWDMSANNYESMDSDSLNYSTKSRWWWIQFESSNGVALNNLKWPSENNFKIWIINYLEDNITVIILLVFSLIISLVYTFIRKKK